jgi:hypothetical protein
MKRKFKGLKNRALADKEELKNLPVPSTEQVLNAIEKDATTNNPETKSGDEVKDVSSSNNN